MVVSQGFVISPLSDVACNRAWGTNWSFINIFVTALRIRLPQCHHSFSSVSGKKLTACPSPIRGKMDRTALRRQ